MPKFSYNFKSGDLLTMTGDRKELGENTQTKTAQAASVKVSSFDLILDSGCSYHICSNESWFDTYKVDDNDEVVIRDGLVCRVEGTSSIKGETQPNFLYRLCVTTMTGRAAIFTKNDSEDETQLWHLSAYALTHSDEKTKLKPKSLEHIVLSFESGVKGFELWDPVNQKRILNSDYAC
ncbi:hypothetical protein L3X38_001889 [Prunus dulcis]|uniref:Uncharacterized protein n=1 Tax=Prunus dulcis TaxID=3755 RepID=A0AAD4WUX8_PRUDU|nr:hypothetical protein L3X38_001889 [Prunus dulcis]